MSDLPVQPTQEEIEQFPAMEGEPVFAEDNTDHPDIPLLMGRNNYPCGTPGALFLPLPATAAVPGPCRWSDEGRRPEP